MFVGRTEGGSYFNRSQAGPRSTPPPPKKSPVNTIASQVDSTGSQARANRVAVSSQNNRNPAFQQVTNQGINARLPSAIKFAIRSTTEGESNASRTANVANAVAQGAGAIADARTPISAEGSSKPTHIPSPDYPGALRKAPHIPAPDYPTTPTSAIPKPPSIPRPDYPGAVNIPTIPRPDYPGAANIPSIPRPDYPGATNIPAKATPIPRIRAISNAGSALGGFAGVVDAAQQGDIAKGLIEAGYAAEGAASLGNKIIQRVAPNTPLATGSAHLATKATSAIPVITTAASGYALVNNVRTLADNPTNHEIINNSTGLVANTANVISGGSAIIAGITGSTVAASAAAATGIFGALAAGLAGGLALGLYFESRGQTHHDSSFSHMF